MGQLTQESIEIIANLTGLAPEEIEKAMENAVLLGGMVGAGIVLGRNALRNYNAK